MSKESFSKKVYEIICKKKQAIENMDLENIFERNKYFEVATCLAYMTLSKEIIIEKDIKNKNPHDLERLKKKIDILEIDRMFKPDFAENIPNIIYSEVNNNLWILDNIRDAIMHGAFEIDENKECFIINNTFNNKKLNAEIPFLWFIAYAKNDILNKRKADIYTLKKCYYNNRKKGQNIFYTKKELTNSILYKVNIYGNNFNISEIENRINELFLEYSNIEINEELIEKYKVQIDKEKIKYDKAYITSFYIAKERVIDTIKKEFPNIRLKIFIENKKYRIINKIIKRTPQYFYDYDTMFYSFNNILSPKDISVLEFITRIIEDNDTLKEIETLYSNKEYDWKEKTKLLHKLLTGRRIVNQELGNLKQIKNQDLQILRSIYLSIYGLSTLVINEQKYNNQNFIMKKPYDFGMLGISKTIYIKYAYQRRKLIMKKLQEMIILAEKNQQLSKCNDISAKKTIEEKINDINKTILEIDNQISILDKTGLNQIFIKEDSGINHKRRQELAITIQQYFAHFNNTDIIEVKKKIRKIIGKIIDAQIEETSKYTYVYCNNIKDILTIIRNCFAHIGRIQIGRNKNGVISIILEDYDNNGEKCARILCNLEDLFKLLSNPYKNEKRQEKQLKRINRKKN